MTLFEAYQKGLKLLKNPEKEEINLRIILCEINGIKSMSGFYFRKDENIKDFQKFFEVLQEFLNGKPLAYIFGKTTFFGDEFIITKNVLIPRLETEEVVDFAIKKINEKFLNKKVVVCDVCAGSGCIGCEIFKHTKTNRVIFSDISESAVKLASRNAQKFGVHGEFYVSNGLDFLDKNVDVVISNPPYILNEFDVDESVMKHEPHIALFIDEELTIYQNIIKKAVKLGVPLIIFEIGYDLKTKLEQIIQKLAPNYTTDFIKDINGKFRICSLEKI